jgi:hypothetical protein
MADFKAEAGKKISEFISDITKLQVTTVTGDLQVNVIMSGNKVDFTKVLTEMSTVPAAGQTSKVKIIASSMIDFDSDVVQYVSAGLNQQEQELVKIHNEAVKNSTEARKAALQSLVSVVNGIL